MKKRFLVLVATCALALAGAMALVGCSPESNTAVQDSDSCPYMKIAGKTFVVNFDEDDYGCDWIVESNSDNLTLVSSSHSVIDEGSSSSANDAGGKANNFEFEGSGCDITTLTFTGKIDVKDIQYEILVATNSDGEVTECASFENGEKSVVLCVD